MKTKTVGSILVVALLVHLYCGVQCFASTIDSIPQKAAVPTESPACHQPGQNAPAPSPPDSSKHGDNNGDSCAQLQSREFKAAPILKSFAQWLTPFEAPAVMAQQFLTRVTLPAGVTVFTPSPLAQSLVLRI